MVELVRPATREHLFVWVMHRFAQVFEEHAILKGGMALQLAGSPRATNDLDYVMVPFTSKSEIAPKIRAVLGELEGADVRIGLHSTMVRAEIHLDGAAIQIEASVAEACPSQAMATGDFAIVQGQPSQVVRVISPDVALAHKLAAWNERRLLRDLYDCYYLRARIGAAPDGGTLDARLAHVYSRLPELKKKRSMTRAELADALRTATSILSDDEVAHELAALVPTTELAGLATRMRAALSGLAEMIEVEGAGE